MAPMLEKLEVGIAVDPLLFAVKLLSGAIGVVVGTKTIFPIAFVSCTAAESSSFVHHYRILLQVKTR